LYQVFKYCNVGKSLIKLKSKGVSMNKAELISKVAEDVGITKTLAGDVLNSFIRNVQESLKSGEKVTLIGFGTFTVSQRKARTGRNPQTGKKMKIPAKKVPKFAAGTAFKAMFKK